MPLQALSQLVSCCRQVSKYFAWAFSAENLFSHDQTQCCYVRGEVGEVWCAVRRGRGSVGLHGMAKMSRIRRVARHGNNMSLCAACCLPSLFLSLPLSLSLLVLPFLPFLRFNYVINKKFEKCSSNHFALLPFTYCLMTFDVANEWMIFVLCVTCVEVLQLVMKLLIRKGKFLQLSSLISVIIWVVWTKVDIVS